MNCVQCGKEVPASAKFCKQCGCKAPAADLPKTAPHGMLPAASPAAYATCPDCGALCKPDARFCNQCGCRFEDTPTFEETRRDQEAPMSTHEEKAILVFGNVQDSTSPAPPHQGERIDTGPAMVIGGSAVAALKPAAPQPVAPVASRTRPSAAAERNPMPQALSGADGSGKWVALGVVAIAAVIGGGAWWWGASGKGGSGSVAAPTPAVAAVPAPVAPPPAALPAESVLAPNETIEPAHAEGVPAAPAPVAVVEPPRAVLPAAQEPPAPKPAARKPARKQTLDDLLN